MLAVSDCRGSAAERAFYAPSTCKVPHLAPVVPRGWRGRSAFLGRPSLAATYDRSRASPALPPGRGSFASLESAPFDRLAVLGSPLLGCHVPSLGA